MTSPILRAYPGSLWREQVRATWAVLNDHVIVRADEHCSTHVHISVDGEFTLQDVKNIAQCALHFESALEVLVPVGRRLNWYAKSNWIDNLELAGKHLTRAQSIAKIEACVNRGQIIALMNPRLHRFYGWNFCSLRSLKTIEFRKGAGSNNADEALAWAELAMTFVESSMKQNVTPEFLSRIPPNIKGLQWFLHQEKAVPGISDPRYFAPLFTNKRPHESVSPLLHLRHPPDMISTLERKIEDDRRRNAVLARRVKIR